MTKRLLIFANAFPFGSWEPYLVQESAHYGAFDEVYIYSLSVRDEQMQTRRDLLDARINVIPIRKRGNLFYAANALLSLGNIDLWKELLHLSKSGDLTARRVVHVFVFFSRADYEARCVKRHIRSHMELKDGDVTTLYSYRFAYQPYLSHRVSKLFRSSRKVARAHRADLYEDRSPQGYLPMRKQSLELLDALCLIAEHGVRYIQDTIPGFDEKLSLHRLGTIDGGLGQHPGGRNPLRIATCSAVTSNKRLPLLASAMSLVPESVAVEWTHYGDGKDMHEFLESVAQMPAHVHLEIKGQVSNRKVLNAYKKGLHHFLVNVSDSEGLPVSMMEAISFGVPVVGTDVGGVSEIISDGLNGVLLPANPDPAEIAQVISRLALLPEEEFDELRAGARATWQQGFDAEANYPPFVDQVLLGNVSE